MPLYRSRAPVLNFDEGLSALGKAFAPPSGAETYAYARARKEQQDLANQQAGISAIRGGSGAIADYINAGVSDPVKASSIADMYRRSVVPGARPQDLDTSSYALNGNAGNTFAGLDVNNRASMQRTQVEQQGQLDRAMVAPVSAGATRFNPQAIADAYQVAPTQTGVVELKQGEQATLPDGRTLAGAPKPLSMDEAKATDYQGLPDPLRRAIVFGNTPTPTVATPDGPRITTAPESLGQAPAPDATTAKPELRNYKAGDRTGTARYDASQGWVDAQTGEKLPSNITTFTSQLSGTADETGLGQTTKNNVEQQLSDAASVESTANTLRGLITRDPGSQGIIGTVMGLGQDIASVAKEGGRLFSPAFQEMQKDIARGIVDPEIAAQVQSYNPNIPQVKLYEMLLAGQVAKMIDPNGRISNDRMKQVTESLGGGGFLSNKDRTTAALDAIQSMVNNRRSMLKGTAPEAAALGQGIKPELPPDNRAPAAAAETWVRGPNGKLQRQQ